MHGDLEFQDAVSSCTETNSNKLSTTDLVLLRPVDELPGGRFKAIKSSFMDEDEDEGYIHEFLVQMGCRKECVWSLIHS